MKYKKEIQSLRKLLCIMLLLCLTSLSVTTKADAKSSSIIMDGSFDDWSQVPHTIVSYGGWNGQCNHQVGLYLDDQYLYIHIQMSDLYGAQLPMNNMVLTVNSRSSFSISMHFPNELEQVDWSQEGTIYHMPLGITLGLGAFSDGSYRYLGEGAYASYNRNHSIGDELEYRVSLDKISQITGISQESIGILEMKFPNLGSQTVCISGASTGSYIGIISSVAMASGFGLLLVRGSRRRRIKE